MAEEARENASVSEQIESLSKEAETFKALQAEVTAKIRELRDKEDVRAGKSFAQEIFTLQQDKLRLETEIELRRKKINRLRLEIDPTGMLH
jgi:hypothetical protein